MEAITIIDSDYKRWVEDLSKRFRQSQIKAAVSVNSEMLRFYWELGRDIVEMHIEERWGDNVIKNLSVDLQREIPDAHCFSRTNLYYTFIFSILGIKKVSPKLREKFPHRVKAQLSPKLRDECCHKLWHNYSPFLGDIIVNHGQVW